MKRLQILNRFFFAVVFALIATSALSKLEAQKIEVEAMCDNRLSVSWSPPPGARGYNIVPAGDGGGKIKCSRSESKCVITGLKPGRIYEYFFDPVNGVPAESSIRLKGPSTGACPEYIAVTPTQRPAANTCANLSPDIVVRGFNPFATQCQRVGDAGVGIDALIARGIIDAVDVYGRLDGEMQVCFRNRGSLLFLDAATVPRAMSELPPESTNGLTCGRINRLGTVVLLAGGDAPVEAPVVRTEASPVSAPANVDGCQLTTTAVLSLRGGPSLFYARRDFIPRGTRLTATARTDGWFMVRYDDLGGWVSGEYVTASAGCGEIGEEVVVFLAPVAEPDPRPTAAVEEAEQQRAEATPVARAAPPGATLSDCWLRTGDIINLRAGPGLEYEIYAEIPYRVNLIALDRDGDWFKVVFAGATGWVNINYVFRNGACG